MSALWRAYILKVIAQKVGDNGMDGAGVFLSVYLVGIDVWVNFWDIISEYMINDVYCQLRCVSIELINSIPNYWFGLQNKERIYVNHECLSFPYEQQYLVRPKKLIQSLSAP